MPPVMLSSRLIVIPRHAGYWGSHFPQPVVDREPVLGLELQQHHRRERLGVATDLPKRVRRDRPSAHVPGAAHRQVDAWPVSAERDRQPHRRNVRRHSLRAQIAAEFTPQRRADRRHAGAISRLRHTLDRARQHESHSHDQRWSDSHDRKPRSERASHTQSLLGGDPPRSPHRRQVQPTVAARRKPLLTQTSRFPCLREVVASRRPRPTGLGLQTIARPSRGSRLRSAVNSAGAVEATA